MKGYAPARHTPKESVRAAEPTATLDYYESLRAAGEPCWFIRMGLQGRPLSDICASPRAAWRNSYESLIASIRERYGRGALPGGGPHAHA